MKVKRECLWFQNCSPEFKAFPRAKETRPSEVSSAKEQGTLAEKWTSTPVYLEPRKMLPWSVIHTRSTINILFILSWSLKYLAVIATELKKQNPLRNKEEQRSKKENHPGKPL